MLRRALPRFTAALFLGTLAGILWTSLCGAWLVHEARLEQGLRSGRLLNLGAIPVPHPTLLAGLTWRDDAMAGLFYGLTAGWPLGGAAAILLMTRRWKPAWVALAGVWVVVLWALWADPVRNEALRWLTGMTGLALFSLLLPAGRRGALAAPLALGVFLAWRFWEPSAQGPLLLWGLGLPWAVAAVVIPVAPVSASKREAAP